MAKSDAHRLAMQVFGIVTRTHEEELARALRYWPTWEQLAAKADYQDPLLLLAYAKGRYDGAAQFGQRLLDEFVYPNADKPAAARPSLRLVVNRDDGK